MSDNYDGSINIIKDVVLPIVIATIFAIGVLFPLAKFIKNVKNQSKLPPIGLIITNTVPVKVGNCEYLALPTSAGWNIITHKGDCTNSIHIYNKQVEK